MGFLLWFIKYDTTFLSCFLSSGRSFIKPLRGLLQLQLHFQTCLSVEYCSYQHCNRKVGISHGGSRGCREVKLRTTSSQMEDDLTQKWKTTSPKMEDDLTPPK